MRFTVFCFAGALAVLPTLAPAMPSCSVTFSEKDLNITQYVHDDDTFDMVGLSGTWPLSGPDGFPSLPTKRFYILIPQDRTCTSVNVTYLDTASVSGEYNVFPCQLSALTDGSPPPSFVEPDSAAYNSTTLYPDGFATLIGEGYSSGYKLAEIEVHPVRYVASERRLLFCSSMHISLNLVQCENLARPVHRRSALSQQRIEQAIRAMVVNPEDVEGYNLGYGFHLEGRPSPGRLAITELPSVEGHAVEYVVITSEGLADAFEPILDWRTRRGRVAALRTVEWIDANYPGCDIQERIRNFIIDAYTNWGTDWVLLGGDEDVVPVRWTKPGQDEPSDLYYADLDGNWNNNQNSYFGDSLSDLDDQTFTGDVGLGRLPVWDTAQVTAFWRKLETYEKSPDPAPDYILGILMAGGSADDDTAHFFWGWGAMDKDSAFYGGRPGLQRRDWFDTCGFERVYELYGPIRDPDTMHKPLWWDGNDELDCQKFIAQFNDGYQFINHADHSSPTTLGTNVVFHPAGGNVLTKAQAALLNNGVSHPFSGSRYSILWTYGCSPGALDHTSIGQTLMNNPNGGCVAFIGNSRPGRWDGQENQDAEFYRLLFIAGVSNVGTAFRYSRNPLDGDRLYLSKTLNLYGDPEMPVWTDVPHTMTAEFTTPVHVGTQLFEVQVKESGNPVSGAIVTVYKVDGDQVELYAWAKTTNGTATFDPLCPESPGEMRVTVTKQNFLPVESTCVVQSSESAYVHFKAIALVDDDDTTGVSYGNGDSIVNPGEHIELTIRLENTGGASATGVFGTLSTSDWSVHPLRDTASFGSIDPNDTASNVTPFVFSVDSNRPGNPCEITFTITMMTQQDTWADDFRIMLMRDSLVPGGHRVTEVSPGSFVMDSLAVTNYGWGAADSVTAVLTSNNSSYVVDDSLVWLDEIAGQSTGVSNDSFAFHDSLQDTSAASFTLRLSDRYGRTWEDTIDLVPPDAPGTPWLILGGDRYLTIGWPKSESSDLRGYNVYRRHDTISGTWHLANRMLVDLSATFRDQGLSPYTGYQYKVSAVDFSGNESEHSESLTTMTTPTYQSGWPAHTACAHQQRTSGVCGNIIGNESLEVVAVMGDSIYAWSHDGQILSGWPKGLGMAPHSSPALGDLDGDGFDEVVLQVSDGQWLYAWKGDGTNAPGNWPLSYLLTTFTGSATIADVDQDGSLEVVGATSGGLMRVWSGTGDCEYCWSMNTPSHSVHGAPAVADLYPDSAGLEILVIAKNANYNDQPSVFCYSIYSVTQDHRLWSRGNPSYGKPGADCNSPVVADLNGDGWLEIVFEVSGGDANDVWVLDHDGNVLDSLGDIDAGMDTLARSPYYPTWACPAVGDINGDSLPEIVISAGYAGKDGCPNATCVAAWELNPQGTWSLMDSFELLACSSSIGFGTGTTLADVDGDGAMEVIVGYWHGWYWNDRIRAFKCVNGSFEEVLTDGFPIYGVDFPEQDLVVTDLDLDGDLELLAFMSEQGVVHTWDFPVKGDRRNVEWSGFHGDVRHTGLYAQPILGPGAQDAYWWGRYKLWGNFTLNNHDLTVQPGTWVQARRWWTPVAGVAIDSGKFTATGTRAAQTYFEAELAGDAWDGIRVSNGSASVTGSNIADATEGLAVTNCDSLRVAGDTFTNYQIGGITCHLTAVSSVEGCYFAGAANAVYGVYAYGLQPSSCVIADNTFSNSGDYGIWVESSLAPDIAGNRLHATGAGTLYGIKCYEIATTPQLLGSIRGNTISGHGQGGILCQASSPRIYSRNDISDNNTFGFDCRDGSFPVVESTDITGHYIGVNAWNVSYPDLGTFQGSIPSGYNSIYDNSTYNVVNANDLPAQTIMAQLNWWGQAPPDSTKFYGSVDYSLWLVEPPGDGKQEKSVTPVFPLALGLGRPNPFSSNTRIMLSNPRQQRLVVSIYDVAGRHVQTLLNAEAPPGRSWLSWNGLDAKGRRVGSGVYFCRLAAGNDKKVSRVVYVRGK